MLIRATPLMCRDYAKKTCSGLWRKSVLSIALQNRESLRLCNYVGSKQLGIYIYIYIHITLLHNSEILPFNQNHGNLKIVRDRQAAHIDISYRILVQFITHPDSRMRVNTNEQQNKRLSTGESSALILRDRVYRLDSHLHIP
jgi:hypothetical protein